MPMSFSMYESWTAEDRNNMVPVRESRRSEERRRRYSTSASCATAKVHINVLPPAEPKKEIHYVQTFVPTPVVVSTPAPTYSIEATAEEIADRILAENTEKNKVIDLQARLEEEQALRMAAEHERGREAARRETEQIYADRRARELLNREEEARRRVAEEYRYQSRSLGNSPKSSGESLWSSVAVASSSSHEGRLVVHDHHHHSHHRSHSDSRDRRCSKCGHSDHRSRDCRDAIYIPTNRVRHITYLS